MAAAIPVGRRRRKLCANATRPKPGGLNRRRLPYTRRPVRTVTEIVRRRDRKPNWNIFTAPEMNALRIRKTGITSPMRMHATIV
jgi:hypothetical protein